MSLASIKTLCNIINKKQAKCLRAYASTYDLVAQYLNSENNNLNSVKVIIAGSEALLDSTREQIQKVCPNSCVISQYANEEAGILAQEAPNQPNIFQLNHASYVFEVLKPDSDTHVKEGEVGRLIITDLYNYACPLIRYDTGDMCCMTTDNQGNKFINKLFGRRLDMVYNTKHEPIFPMFFARILKNYPNISQWQFIQHKEKSHELKLVINHQGKI